MTEHDTKDTLARRARLATGLSQKAFAALVGAHVITVAKWESDEHPPSKTAARLLRLIEAKPKLCVRILERSLAEDAAELDELARAIKKTVRGADDVRRLGAARPKPRRQS
ncbi:MAG TPA: helix-turn-helix domain-containing protein [Planctomycetota bacterium]|nr:helix-turn-helix domain-containing protein [Planctomycetota bacterium]